MRCELPGGGDGNLTVAYTCGAGQKLFTVVTFGTANQQQDSSWLGLPSGAAYKRYSIPHGRVPGGLRAGAYQWGIRRADLQRADFEPAVCRGCGAAAAIDGRAAGLFLDQRFD